MILMFFLFPILLLFSPVLLIATIVIITIIVNNEQYKESAYYKINKHPYRSVRYNTGRYGEYLTYKNLKYMEGKGAKFLFNVYIPKSNGETTEIDVLMICPKGIFVFESKNYSGWIFGSEDQKNWCQILPTGRGRSHKELFYNPVMQNRSHIKHLRTFLGEQVPMRSIIVFSDRCKLKRVNIKSNDINVINRCNVGYVVSAICNQIPVDILSENIVSKIYNKLYPFTQLDEAAKAQHIANIRNNSEIRNVSQYRPVYAQPGVSKSEAYQNRRQLKCPRCNGNLILRTAARGSNAGNKFYGCSNYPKCKYIQNILKK